MGWVMLTINFRQTSCIVDAWNCALRQDIEQHDWWIFNHSLPLFWHICGFSSLLSAQSGSPSHMKVLWMQSPLLHVNCRSMHFRFRAGNIRENMEINFNQFIEILIQSDDVMRQTRHITIYIYHEKEKSIKIFKFKLNPDSSLPSPSLSNAIILAKVFFKIRSGLRTSE